MACASAAVLAWPPAGAARYVPRLVVEHARAAAGGAATTISIQLTREDDATAKATVYVPRAHRGVLARQDGAEIGTVAASFQATATSPQTIVTLRGAVRADDPAAHAGNTCAPGIHGSVWLLLLETAGRTLTVPVYVDAIDTGPEAAFARFRLELCLPRPDLPEGQGGAPFGAKLVSVTLRFRSVLFPFGPGVHVWPGVFTPYASDGRPDVPATVEARAVVRLPGRLSLAGRITNRRQRTILLSGALTENGLGLRGMLVELLVGGRRAFGVRTGSTGRYALALRRRGRGRVTSVFRARATVPARDVTASACGGPSLAPRGCASATASRFTALSRAVRITL